MKILFVCTGNTCRSPMAEALARKYLGSQFEIFSAGINALEGQRLSKNAEEVLKEKAIDASKHKAFKLTRGMLASADYVFTMTNSQGEYLVQLYPEYEGKIKALGKWLGLGREVTDPFGGSLEVYRRCLQELDELVQALASKISDK